MENARNLAGVHTSSLNNNVKVNKMKKGRNIILVSKLDTG